MKKNNIFSKVLSFLFAIAFAFCSCGLLISSLCDNNSFSVFAYQKDDILIEGDDFETRGFISPSDYIYFDQLYYDEGVYGRIYYGSNSLTYRSSINSSVLSFVNKGDYDVVTYSNLIYVYPVALKIDLDPSLIGSFHYYSFYSSQLTVPVSVPDFYFGLWLNIEYDSVVYNVYFLTSFESSEFHHISPPSSLFDFGYPTAYIPALVSMFDIWSAIFDWVILGISSVVALFFVNNELTILGILAIVGIGISLFFLIVYFIVRFIKLKG